MECRCCEERHPCRAHISRPVRPWEDERRLPRRRLHLCSHVPLQPVLRKFSIHEAISQRRCSLLFTLSLSFSLYRSFSSLVPCLPLSLPSFSLSFSLSHPPARVMLGAELQARGSDSLKRTTASELPGDHSQETPTPKKLRVSSRSSFSTAHLWGGGPW